MTFNTNSKSYRKIYPGEKHFHFSPDGIKLVPRSGIEIIEQCPANIRDTLAYAFAKGYVQPVAYMPDEEYMWHDLRD